MIPLPYKLGTMAVIAGALAITVCGAYFAGYWRGVSNERADWQEQIDKQKADAANMLADATAHVLLMEREAKDRARQIEVNNANHQIEVAAERARNDNLARQLGGLRDTGRRRSCAGAVPTAATAAGVHGAGPAEAELSGESPQLLSPDAGQFILDLAADADRAAYYAADCRAWADTVSKAGIE